jgi:hypothetical protein
MSHWTSLTFLTWPILVMAEILLGLASMPHTVMMCTKCLPWGTPKVHFSEFNLMLKHLRLLKVSSRSVMRLLLYLDFMLMLLT